MATLPDISRLTEAAEEEISKGLLACQWALARNGELIGTQSLGPVQPETRFWIASATKPMVASAVWILMDEHGLELGQPVAEYLPEFAENGKARVTLEQVMVMTAGFPNASMTLEEGGDPERRRKRMASWQLEWDPGTRYVYHGASAHWVLAELIERVSQGPYCDFIEQRITAPLGLPRALGIARAEQTNVAQMSETADPETRSEFDYATKIEIGEPGGGAIMTAPDLAHFYQGLLNNPAQQWEPSLLADGTGHIRCRLLEESLKMPANRTTGVVVGAGFGSAWGDSESAFGWTGVGGQIAFGDPASGISFAFLQMGDHDPTRAFMRGARLSRRALRLTL
ncbi:MAG: serine hydrolase [Myxococcota bacterium]|nr:serine hydrolase [Myxococcota bacterium]